MRGLLKGVTRGKLWEKFTDVDINVSGGERIEGFGDTGPDGNEAGEYQGVGGKPGDGALGIWWQVVWDLDKGSRGPGGVGGGGQGSISERGALRRMVLRGVT